MKHPEMTMRQLAVLFVLAAGRMRLKDVALELQVPKPSVSRAFSGLYQAGLIDRVREDGDSRQVYGILTRDGEKLLRGIG